MNETWKPIPNFPGYEVSNLGNVRSLKRTSPHVMSPSKDNRGRRGLCLRRDGETHRRWISPLVLLAFVGPPPTGHFCQHKNGNPGDDRLENLEYALFENRLTEEAVVQIRLERKNGASGKELADKYGVEESTIYGVCLGKVYAWCGGPITEPWEIRGKARNLKIPDEDAVEIYYRVKGGETRTAIAEEFGVCIKTISKIADGKREATRELSKGEKE